MCNRNVTKTQLFDVIRLRGNVTFNHVNLKYSDDFARVNMFTVTSTRKSNIAIEASPCSVLAFNILKNRFLIVRKIDYLRSVSRAIIIIVYWRSNASMSLLDFIVAFDLYGEKRNRNNVCLLLLESSYRQRRCLVPAIILLYEASLCFNTRKIDNILYNTLPYINKFNVSRCYSSTCILINANTRNRK